MVRLNSLRETKVAMTVYVQPKVKRGMKVLAGIGNTTTSKIVENLCVMHLSCYPEVQDILEKEG